MTRARLALILAISGLLCRTLHAVQGSDSQSQQNKHVGDASCLSCHKDQSLSYMRTSHHLTSQAATPASVLGSFQEGTNVLKIIDPALTTALPVSSSGWKRKMAAFTRPP